MLTRYQYWLEMTCSNDQRDDHAMGGGPSKSRSGEGVRRKSQKVLAWHRVSVQEGSAVR